MHFRRPYDGINSRRPNKRRRQPKVPVLNRSPKLEGHPGTYDGSAVRSRVPLANADPGIKVIKGEGHGGNEK